MRQHESDQIPMGLGRPDYDIYHFRTMYQPVELHFHDFYEIYVLLSGTVTYLIDGYQYNVRPGDILLIGPKEMHRPISIENPQQPYERIDIYVRPEYIVSHSMPGANLMSCFEQRSNLLRTRGDMHAQIFNVIERLEKHKAEGGYGSMLLDALLPTELLVYLNRASQKTTERIGEDMFSNKYVERVIHYINGHLNEDLSLDVLAEHLFISKYHLSREFKRNTGLTLHRFVRYKRLLTARAMLRTGASVTDVCYACGFEDYSNFIRVFRTEFGMSPHKYAISEINFPPDARYNLQD